MPINSFLFEKLYYKDWLKMQTFIIEAAAAFRRLFLRMNKRMPPTRERLIALLSTGTMSRNSRLKVRAEEMNPGGVWHVITLSGRFLVALVEV